MVGYGTMLLGGVGALRMVDLPELTRMTGRGLLRVALHDAVWYWAFYVVLMFIAYLTNPSDASFRTFLTDLSFHQHLRRLRSPQSRRPSATTLKGEDDGKAGATGTIAAPHVLTFSNRIAISLRTPPYVRRDFIFFSYVSVTAPPPSAAPKITASTGLTKAAEASADGLEEGLIATDPTETRPSTHFYIGMFGKWYSGIPLEPAGGRDRVADSVVSMESLDPTLDSKESGTSTPPTDEQDYIPTEGKLPTQRSTSGSGRSTKVLPRVLRAGQKKGTNQQLVPTTLSDLRARAKTVRAQQTSPSASPSSVTPPNGPATGATTTTTPASHDDYLSTHTDKNFPGLPFHVSRPTPIVPPATPEAASAARTSVPDPPGSPDLPSALMLAGHLTSSDPAIIDLQTQLDEVQATNAATESRLQAELDELRARKRDEDSTRSDLRARTRSLEDGKRAADLDRVAAEKKLMSAKASRHALVSRLEKVKRELVRLEAREKEASASVERGSTEAKEEEEALRTEIEEKRREAREAESLLADEKARRTELQARLEARKQELYHRRESAAARKTRARIEAHVAAQEHQRHHRPNVQLLPSQLPPTSGSLLPSESALTGPGAAASLYPGEPQGWGSYGTLHGPAPDTWDPSLGGYTDGWTEASHPHVHYLSGLAGPEDDEDPYPLMPHPAVAYPGQAGNRTPPRSTTPTGPPPDPTLSLHPRHHIYTDPANSSKDPFGAFSAPRNRTVSAEESKPFLAGFPAAGTFYTEPSASDGSGYVGSVPRATSMPVHDPKSFESPPRSAAVHHPHMPGRHGAGGVEGGPLSPVTPHQTSLIPSHLFSMLDHDEPDEAGRPSQGSPSPVREIRLPSHQVGQGQAHPYAHHHHRPPVTLDPDHLFSMAHGANSMTRSSSSLMSSSAPTTTTAPATSSIDAFDPFRSPWAGVFGPIGGGGQSGIPSSSSMPSTTAFGAVGSGNDSATATAGGSRMKALFNRSGRPAAPPTSAAATTADAGKEQAHG